ncbi:MAG: putative exonuclease subunit 2 [Prokaryotic dsDNA virus sp.]|nr:MAG: putative exonuclease subunit 2 [Prokaryotic dsDNA virus sp.]|tara:strand:+ start:21025 stop:22041 length:1017 start_codon:yes stop_codon:yes gene_type:complete
MKLKSIKLKNFQAHEELRIVFDKHVTTIRGHTDRGKSSVLRALQWACLNNLTGHSFVRDGADVAEVVLRVTGNHEIIRGRGRGSRANSYSLDEKVYHAFGSKVPQDIQTALALSPINFQSQHDPPFLFSLNPGEVSRQLNSVVDLSIMDRTMQRAAGFVHSTSSELRVYEKELEKLEEEYEELKPWNKRNKELQHLARMVGDGEVQEKRISQLERLLSDMDGLQLSKTATLRNDLENLCKEGRKLRKAIVEHLKLDKLLTALAKHMEREPAPDFDPLTDAWTEYEELDRKRVRLNLLLGDIQDAEEKVSRKLSTRTRLEKRFHANTKGQQCPICLKTM